MRIETQRFGTLRLNPEQLFLFPQGLIGMESLRQWALLPDPDNGWVAWLQSASRGDRAIALVSPRAFFPEYRVHITKRELTGLHMQTGSELYILTSVSGHVGKLATNLRSPFLLNLDRRLGCQIITSDEQPISESLPLKRSSDQDASIDLAAQAA